ncbi:hypothetical protein KGR20_08675 [Cytobacillus oceanisediminis]|uniref:hypothetical protein n=1 Tax=Cytobacillus oceanisediminis TaxID=665099 RepID=UPI001CCD607E|nr:hypothetical protein [Cytobacillus oceanisediminis]MBZ9534332.1 hypothetical protein [Cytobacillus oceanisediminis]
MEFKSDFTHENFKDKYLGKFIDEQLPRGKRKRKTYKEKSGTIKDKLPFCKKAIKNITKFEELSAEAQELSKKLYEFIKLNN